MERKLLRLALPHIPRYPSPLMQKERELLWPTLTDEERRIAEENLSRYLEIAWDIWNELQGRESTD